jgi:hypothetical protein
MTNMDRRPFLAAAGITALAHGRSVPTSSNSSSEPLPLTGIGERGRDCFRPEGFTALQPRISPAQG